jgi:hypothetical protein
MARACSICNHPQRAEIDSALALGQSARSIAAQFGCGDKAAARHHENHLSPAIVAVAAVEEERRLGDLVGELEAVTVTAKRMLQKASDEGLQGQAQGWMREFRSCVELLLKVTGQLHERPTVTVNLLSSPEVALIFVAMDRALGPWPDAKIALAASLKAIDVVRAEEVTP